MNTIRRALIVDDESDARLRLRRLLANHPEVEIVGEAANVPEALRIFQSEHPNLIFLDVQMPKRDGFSLLPELRPVPDIIFTTAYDSFAVKAFEVNAVDFLLKPIYADRLALSLARLARPPKRKAKPFTKDIPIFLYTDHETRVVNAREITHLTAAHNHCLVHLVSYKPVMMLRKISEWNRLLPSELFLRLDRSTIINTAAIRDMISLENRHALVHFQGVDEPFELHRVAARSLRKALRAISLP